MISALIDAPYEESKKVTTDGALVDVSLTSPNSSYWTVRITPDGAEIAATYEYSPHSQAVLYRPGDKHDEEPTPIPMDEIGANLLKRLHEGLFGFFD